VSSESICDFPWKLRKAHSGHYYVHVIWDNASVQKNNQVYEFAEKLSIKLHYLPSYSHNLDQTPLKEYGSCFIKALGTTNITELFLNLIRQPSHFLGILQEKEKFFERELMIIFKSYIPHIRKLSGNGYSIDDSCFLGNFLGE